MFGSLLKWIPFDTIWSFFPQMVRPILDEYIRKDLTESDRERMQGYIDTAQKANVVFSWFAEELENILQGKPVNLDRVEKLRKWEIPEKER